MNPARVITETPCQVLKGKNCAVLTSVETSLCLRKVGGGKIDSARRTLGRGKERSCFPSSTASLLFNKCYCRLSQHHEKFARKWRHLMWFAARETSRAFACSRFALTVALRAQKLDLWASLCQTEQSLVCSWWCVILLLRLIFVPLVFYWPCKMATAINVKFFMWLNQTG